jgi:hypothetical protein
MNIKSVIIGITTLLNLVNMGSWILYVNIYDSGEVLREEYAADWLFFPSHFYQSLFLFVLTIVALVLITKTEKMNHPFRMTALGINVLSILWLLWSNM